MNGHNDRHPVPEAGNTALPEQAHPGGAPTPTSGRSCRACPTALQPEGEWIIALDPATGRFRFDIPATAGGSRHSEQKWLMLAIAACIDNERFREHIVQAAFSEVVDRATSH